MIYVNHPESIPSEIEEEFLRYVERVPPDVIAEIKRHKIIYPNDVRIAIEKHLAPFKAEMLYHDLLLLFEETEICCFHATKILDESQILSGGLRTNDWEHYSATLRDALHQAKLSESTIINALNLVYAEYLRKGYDRQGNQLCFFTPMQLADGGDTVGYDQFCQNVGGELARWSLKGEMPNIYKALKTIGTPVIVEFALPFRMIADYQKESIVYCFVAHYSAKRFWRTNCPIEFDGTTNQNVLPSQIIHIHQWKKVDYE